MKQKKRIFFEILKRFTELVKIRKVAYLKYNFVSFIWGINGIIHILFLERITYYLQDFNKVGFNKILFYYIFFIIIYEIVNFSTKKWGWVETTPLGIADIYKKYLNKYIVLDNNKIEIIGTGKLIGIIQSGADKWSELLAECFEKGISLFVSFLFTIYMIAKVDIFYSIIFLILFILFMIVSIFFNLKLIPLRELRYKNRNLQLKSVVKILMNKNEIFQSGKINKEIDNIYNYSYDLVKINKDMGTNRNNLKRAPQLGVALILFFTFWFLGNEVLVGNMKLNIVVGLTGVLIIMQKSISEIVDFYVKITKDFVDIEGLWNFFDNTLTIKGYNKGKEFEYNKGNIEINNLEYGYNKNNLIFRNLNLKIKGGAVTAFVGNSGAGKSTLVKLISGYIRVNKGDIIIDNQKINDISLKSYYKNIGYLTQDPSVFDGTILDNLTYAINRKLKKFEIEEIIKKAKCEFIYEFEKGLNTEIGERGIRLSGGQKQRLAIAKIFLKNPKIIILDEPTSALDSFSEEQITKAMYNLFENRTVIIIAHRLQTVKHANDIILFENGEIIERGTHMELIKLKGQYAKMLELQSGF